MYENLYDQLSDFFTQVRVVSQHNVWQLFGKEYNADEIEYHVNSLRYSDPVIRDVPNIQQILELNSEGNGVATISELLGCKRHTVNRVLEAAKAKKIAWPLRGELVDYTNRELESVLFTPREIFYESRAQAPITAEILSVIDKSLTVLCSISKPSELESVIYDKYPTMVNWISKKRAEDGSFIDKVYDVTIVDRNSLSSVAKIVPIIRRNEIPAGMPDITIHIAVIPGDKNDPAKPDPAFFSEVTTFCEFSVYCVIDQKGLCHFYNKK